MSDSWLCQQHEDENTSSNFKTIEEILGQMTCKLIWKLQWVYTPEKALAASGTSAMCSAICTSSLILSYSFDLNKQGLLCGARLIKHKIIFNRTEFSLLMWAPSRERVSNLAPWRNELPTCVLDQPSSKLAAHHKWMSSVVGV